jgi:hypothetical protein
MDFQEVVAKLGEDEKGVVLAAIEAEKQRGIEETKRKGAENAKLRRENEGFKTAIKNTFEFDVTNVDELPTVLSKFKTQTVNNSDFVPKKDFEFLKNQIAEEKALREAANKEIRNGKIAEKLNKIIGESFHAADYLIRDMISSGKVRLTESGDVAYVEGDEEVEITKGIEKLKKARPDLVKNTSRPGSGGAGGGKDKSKKEISLDEFNSLPGIERAKLMAEGYKLT